MLGTANEGVAGIGAGTGNGVYGQATGERPGRLLRRHRHGDGYLTKSAAAAFQIDHPLDPENKYL